MSKVVFKMTFKHPNKSDSVSKNVSHVVYISTRSGVDKSVTEADLKKELEKGIEDIPSDDETYVQYIDERPRSHGLFGKDGIEDPKEVQEEVSNVESFVWRAIVSLREDDAKELGYTDKEAWQNMLRSQVPGMADKMGIRATNLRWVAAVHMEQGHPHAHIMFWEKTPEKTVGVVKPKILTEIRKSYTDEIFEEQRMGFLTEKNSMRDLIRDLANNDISNVSKLIREVNKAGIEISEILGDDEQEGIAPKLYPEGEKELIYKIKNLSEMLPGKGRIALKFMPENVKEEVGKIADELLNKQEFNGTLEKNLKAVEELTKLYTGKEADIQKARDNAYNDVRDRISQIILKGAAECKRDNIFYVDQELAHNAVEFIKSIDSQINLNKDYEQVMNEISTALVRIGNSEEEILKHLSNFTEREELNLSKETLETIIKDKITNGAGSNSLNSLSFQKNVQYYLSVLKLSGYEEGEAFNALREAIKDDSKELEKKFIQLKEDGILKKVGEQYNLTNKGIEEFLKVKELDKAEREILKSLESDGKDIPKLKFEEFIENQDIYNNLRDKDPEEFKMGNYDTKIREHFGENNEITLNKLEEDIYDKYTDDELTINMDKAEVEIELIEKRINKLTLNGYVKFDRELGIYSFTDESNNYFQYDTENENYNLTDAAKEKFDIKGFEFTRYDASVNLAYIDKAEDNILSKTDLREILKGEIANQEAKDIYERAIEIVESEEKNPYINIDEEGNIKSTDEGRKLGLEINKLNKCFYFCRGNITEDKLKEFCKKEFGDSANEKFNNITEQLDNGVEKGYILKNEEKLSYTIEPISNDINKISYQIYKEGGTINKDNLKEVLENNVVNKGLEKQLKYLIRRFDKLAKHGYLDGSEEGYSLSSQGIEERKNILEPQRDLLKGKLDYLKKLGFLDSTEEGFQVTEKYYTYMKNVAEAKESKTERVSENISKDISNLIDRTQNKVNLGKIERSNERVATGKYINGEYETIKSNYKDVREACNVIDTQEKTLNNISKSLLISGVSLEETKEILQQWNLKTNSNIEVKIIDEIVDKSYEIVKENNLWGDVTVISTKDWKEMFESLGVEEKDMPKWIYKGENWKSFSHGVGLGSIINDIWKASWRQMEMDRMRTQSQVQNMKKHLLKQGEKSKSAMVEQARKNKDRGSKNQDDFEI